MTDHRGRPRPAGASRRTWWRRLLTVSGAATALWSTLIVPLAVDSSALTGFTFTQQFQPGPGNEQGLAFADGMNYVGYDVGSGNGQIIEYDRTGVEVRRTGPIPIGHTAEISFRQADGNLYVSNGSTVKTLVHVVNMRLSPPAVIRTYDFTSLGTYGKVAIDNQTDEMVLFAGPAGGPYTLAFADMRGTLLRKYTVADQGLPQGLEAANGQVLLYTSAPDLLSNTITALTRQGVVTRRIPVPVASEGEGLSIDAQTNQLFVGFHYPSRVLRMSPVFAAPIGNNLLANPNAESGRAGTDPAVALPIPSWTVSGGLTAMGYQVGPLLANSPGPASRGAGFFAGGASGISTASQRVDVSAAAADIDTGHLTFALSGWLGGYLNQNDNARVAVTFLGGAGQRLGRTQIGPVYAADRHNVTGLLARSTAGLLPKGTRTFAVLLTATRVTGSNNDGYADNLTMVLAR